MRVLWYCTLLALASFIGCTANEETSKTSDSTAGAGTQDSTTQEDSTNEEGSATRKEGSATREDGSGTVATDPPTKPDRVKADVGEGEEGSSLKEFDTGVQAVFAEPAKAFFGFRQRAVFQIRIPDALNKYKGANGHAPKSHEDFMSQIIETNKIQLPDLPPGRKYVYDPEKEELMIER